MAAKFSTFLIYMLGFLWFCFTVWGDPNTSLLHGACSLATYNRGDPYMYSLQYVLQDLSTRTPALRGYNYYTQSPYPAAVSYGHAECNTALSYTDCNTCMNILVKQIIDRCYATVGAELVLQDCQMRYEQYLFY